MCQWVKVTHNFKPVTHYEFSFICSEVGFIFFDFRVWVFLFFFFFFFSVKVSFKMTIFTNEIMNIVQ